MAIPETVSRSHSDITLDLSTGNKVGDHSRDDSLPSISSATLESEKAPAIWRLEDTPNIGPASLPILYQFLDFDTHIPSPVSYSRKSDAPIPPEPPSLSAFTSPFSWSSVHKSCILVISCVGTFLAAFTSGAYSPSVQQMASEWHVSTVAVLVGVTTFTTGFGLAPMVLAPFSEANGRYPVFLWSGLLFAFCQASCAYTKSLAGFLVARFFVGVSSSVFSTNVGGVLSDIYHAPDRNAPMAYFCAFALAGTGSGSVVGGFVGQALGWRWIFWLQVIFDGLLLLVMAAWFPETRGSVLLRRKAQALNRWYEELEKNGYPGLLSTQSPTDANNSTSTPVSTPGTSSVVYRIRWRAPLDGDSPTLPTLDAPPEKPNFVELMRVSLIRPFYLLFTEPVVFWFSAWISFSWAVLYLNLASIPIVFRSVYGFTPAQCGAVFSGIVIGAIISTPLFILQERVAKRRGWLPDSPEARLYFVCPAALFMPVGIFIFAWTSRETVSWAVPAVAVGISTIGIYGIYLATFNYLADTYHCYASSAIAAQSCCRNLLGGVFPLVIQRMYGTMGYGGAGSLLGGIALLLSAVPWVLVVWGERIRARSIFAQGMVVLEKREH
ncbi:putative MFS multidrug transporter [Trichodelitschia bisporula]|uniref:Putative MFS multidrug transporter n=1 Tax=Trichodelitschia bisporula TaxID=703511 RepID=A0A6G1I3G2_9PEZI|nr:putative MFS multidrug transporter [Trichodelitschia bisporula]